MTLDQLRQICPYNAERAAAFVQPLTDAMQEFGITTARQQAAFIAQVAHETGEFRYMREIGSGVEYEGRKDLGNTKPGDGPLYKGGGGLMGTGRDFYTWCGPVLGIDLVLQPSRIEVPEYAMRSAGAFWQRRKLSDYADVDHFGALTHAINGGYNGLDPRIAYWLSCRKMLAL
jgi:putative chitinase